MLNQAPSTDEYPLILDGVSKSFGAFKAVNHLSICVRAGECFGLLGPNGAGKTTTLRLALGLTQADAGQVFLLGQSMPSDASLARQRVGVVPQNDALDPDFSVRENLEVFASYFGFPREVVNQKIPELLAFAALDKRASDKVTGLSGGLRRRLTLARALINSPDMIFLDEPTTALDPQARHLIWERLQQLRDQGKTLLLTTHFMDEAQRLCDRIAIIDQGQLVCLGTPRDLIKEHIGGDVLELFGRNTGGWLSANQGTLQANRVETAGETAFVYADNLKPWLYELEQTPVDSRPDYLFRPANLEDVFLRLTGRDLRDN